MVAYFAGFIGIIVLETTIILLNSREWMNTFFKWMKAVVYPFSYTILISLTFLFCGLLSLCIGECWYSAALCSVFLVATWIAVEKTYEQLDSKRFLQSEEKHICHILAGASMVLTSIFNRDYLFLGSITLSILIGAYFSIDDIFNGNTIKQIMKKDWKKISSGMKLCTVFSSVTAAALLCSLFYTRRLPIIADNLHCFGFGVLSGGMLIIIALYVKNMIQKQK